MQPHQDKRINTLAQAIHEAKIRFCWGHNYVGNREPWALPNASSPIQPWHDIAIEQAKAVLAYLRLEEP